MVILAEREKNTMIILFRHGFDTRSDDRYKTTLYLLRTYRRNSRGRIKEKPEAAGSSILKIPADALNGKEFITIEYTTILTI